MFTHLHVHTDYSLLDGMSKVKDYVKRLKELNMTSGAITDHGSMSGVIEFCNEAKAAGIKPIIGCEFYEAPGNRTVKQAEDGENYHHLVLIAKNLEGYTNLCRLTTRSNTEGFYYKPRIDMELLEKYHDGLICLSACLAGRLPKEILKGNYEKALETAMKYKDIFGDDYYLEIQNHGIKEEETVAQELVKISKKLGIKLVCTNDCHYLRSSDATAHEWLLCMQTKKKINEPHMKYEGDYSVKSEDEMRKLFPGLPEAFDNTQEIVNKVTFDIDELCSQPYRMPKIDIPEEFNNDYYAYFESESWKGFNERYPEGHLSRSTAMEKLKYELSVIKNMGFHSALSSSGKA